MSRDISASNCTGQAAVRIVIVETWMKVNKIDDDDAVEELGIKVLQEGGTFLNYTDVAVGRVLIQHTNLVDSLFEWVNSNPLVKAMADYDYVKLSANRPFIEGYLSSHFGSILKDTKWWEKNRKGFDKHRRDLKMVGKIMSE